LLGGYDELHLAPLVQARRGVGEPEHVGRLRAGALASLVCGQTRADQPMALRSLTAAEALGHGASAVHLATALNLEIDEVTTGLRSRADGQHQHAGMSAAARDQVHALLDDREAGR
jgi:hypothetical protein